MMKMGTPCYIRIIFTFIIYLLIHSYIHQSYTVYGVTGELNNNCAKFEFVSIYINVAYIMLVNSKTPDCLVHLFLFFVLIKFFLNHTKYKTHLDFA